MSMPFKLITLFLFSLLLSQQAQAKDVCLGTFSSFRFNSEAGDLLGVEIKIVYTRLGNQAVIQFSEGEPSPLVVVSAQCDDHHVFFKLPGENGLSPGHFDGSVSKDRLVGEFIYDSGGREKVTLPRRKGYWD